MAKQTKAGLNPEPFLLRKSGTGFFNTSPLDVPKLMGDQDNIRINLLAYTSAFSSAVKDIFDAFEFPVQIDRLAKADLPYQVTEKFAGIDLRPEKIDNIQMGIAFEELRRGMGRLQIVPTPASLDATHSSYVRPQRISLRKSLLLPENDRYSVPRLLESPQPWLRYCNQGRDRRDIPLRRKWRRKRRSSI